MKTQDVNNVPSSCIPVSVPSGDLDSGSESKVCYFVVCVVFYCCVQVDASVSVDPSVFRYTDARDRGIIRGTPVQSGDTVRVILSIETNT